MLLRRIHRRQEDTSRFGMVMPIYNPLSQQEEDEMDRRFTEAVDTLEIVPENNNAIERINFGVKSSVKSKKFVLEPQIYKKTLYLYVS